MKTDRPDAPPTLPEVVLEEGSKEGFALFGRMVEEFDGYLKCVAVPRKLLEGGAPSEAGARALQRLHEAFYGLGNLSSRRWWEHG